MSQENSVNEAAKILIVDDVSANRFVLRDIIQEMGYQPILAKNGVQALKIVNRLNPQLIILDIAMPEMDGYELCKTKLVKAGLQLHLKLYEADNEKQEMNRRLQISVNEQLH